MNKSLMPVTLIAVLAAVAIAPDVRSQEFTIEPGDIRGNEPDYSPYVDRNIPNP